MKFIPDLELLLRLGLAVVAGAVLGLERESRGQLAGMRTHALVATGACLFTLGGAYGFPELPRGSGIDPMRVAAQVASGIGFVGAGAVIRDRGGARGVTTAASLWVSAALGMTAGAGLTHGTVLGILVTLLGLVGLRFLRDHVVRRFARARHSISAAYRRGHGTLALLMSAVSEAGAHLRSLQIDDDHAEGRRRVVLVVQARDSDRLRHALLMLADRPEVDTITYQ